MDIKRLRELAGMDQEPSQGQLPSDVDMGGPNVGNEDDDGEDLSSIVEQVKQDLEPLFNTDEGCDLLADLVEFIEDRMSSSCGDGDDDIDSDIDSDEGDIAPQRPQLSNPKRF